VVSLETDERRTILPKEGDLATIAIVFLILSNKLGSGSEFLSLWTSLLIIFKSKN
jgi:hypothetical protein